MVPTWGPSGADRSQVGPMLVPWTFLYGYVSLIAQRTNFLVTSACPFIRNATTTSIYPYRHVGGDCSCDGHCLYVGDDKTDGDEQYPDVEHHHCESKGQAKHWRDEVKYCWIDEISLLNHFHSEKTNITNVLPLINILVVRAPFPRLQWMILFVIVCERNNFTQTISQHKCHDLATMLCVERMIYCGEIKRHIIKYMP